MNDGAKTTASAAANVNSKDTVTPERTNIGGAAAEKQLQEQRQIRVLPQDVVDKIAAGEVVQRPVSVIKELIENALDADATTIQVHIEHGCLVKMSVIDDGNGISKSDLPLLATRHATSKLVSTNDFETLATFGFRGEALAATSMVSKMTVTTKKRRRNNDNDVAVGTTTIASSSRLNIAYTHTYENGRPIHSQPRPCARSKSGTTVVIENLFYNVAHRRRAYEKRDSEEYNKILAVVQQYAVHYPTVGFVCQRSRPGKGKSVGLQMVVDCNTSQLKCVQAAASAAVRRQQQGLTTKTDCEEPIIISTDDDVKLKVMDATKEVVSQVLESNIGKQLMYLECSVPSSSPSSSSSVHADDDSSGNKTAADTKTMKERRHIFQYSAEMYFTPPFYESKITTGSSSSKATRFILFLNDRLVDFHPLKRSLEGVYSQLHGQGGSSSSSQPIQTKPVLVVSVHVPGWQVDVNVHPSKQRVSLVYEEELIDALSQELRKRLEQEGRLFHSAPPSSLSTPENDKSNKTTAGRRPIHNPYALGGSKTTKNTNVLVADEGDEDDDDDDEMSVEQDTPKTYDSKRGKASSSSYPTNAKKPRTTPSQVIRTSKAAPVGAIEPYLVRKSSTYSQRPSQSQSQSQQAPGGSQMTPLIQEEDKTAGRSNESYFNNAVVTPTTRFVHLSGCPLSSSSSERRPDDAVDLTQPGAFASVLQKERCTCPRDDEARRAIMIKQTTVVRPKKVIPTVCEYTSIEGLRGRIQKRVDKNVTKQLREAHFIGCVSDQRSLIQCGQHLVLINHLEMAEELFYQLSLASFRGGAPIARLGPVDGTGGIHIETAIGHAFQVEDDLISSEERGDLESIHQKASVCDGRGGMLLISNTNRRMARQATMCLLENAEMMEHYFSIRIERRPIKNSSGTEKLEGDEDDDIGCGREASEAVLTGLPELLEGHCPSLHGLPIFLLRLATQVDWNEEKSCFHGISKELGSYYAMLPSTYDQDGGGVGDGSDGDGNDNMQIRTTTSSSSYVQHRLFPALSGLLSPPKRLSKEGHFAVQTNLADLYKIFKR